MRMNTDPILANIGRYITLDPTEKEYFISLLHSRLVKRRQALFHEGDVCRQSAFVIAGCLRGYSIDDEGTEHVIGFAPEDWWIADMYSLLTQKPGILTVDALEDTTVLLLGIDEQNALYERVPKFERFFRILVEKSLVAHQRRLIESMSLSAEQRYRNFCARYPSLVERVAQKHIASYIGVTPEFFSKMRSRMMREGT
jgi:CRP-like cAMP-binding protein